MQQENVNRRSALSPRNESPEKFRRTPQDGGSVKRDVKQRSDANKRRVQYSPNSSPEKCRRTPQGFHSAKRDQDSHREDIKRKGSLTPRNESPEKMRRVASNGKFVNTLIANWSKHMGLPPVMTPTKGAQDSFTEEMRQEYESQRRNIGILQKKLQEAMENISSLTVSQEMESRSKEEILEKMSAIWESIEIITKHCNYISESLTGFQQHHANLSGLYNNVISVNKSNIQNLKQQLSDMKIKETQREQQIDVMRNNLTSQTSKMQDMVLAQEELKKQLEYAQSKLLADRGNLESAHAAEKLKLVKEQEVLMSANAKLNLELQKVVAEKDNVSALLAEKDTQISKLRDEISECKKQIQDLQYQNSELATKFADSVEKGDELSREMESKLEEEKRLRKNLEERQRIQSDLTTDVDLIERKYTSQVEQHKTLQSNFENLERKLKETEAQNRELKNSVQELRNDNGRELLELNKKLDVLEENNENRLLEKQAKIEDIKGSMKSLSEKHASQTANLKKDYERKLSEIKSTITTQTNAVAKLNQSLEKANAEGQTLREKLRNMKEFNEKLQSVVKEKSEALAAKTIAQSELGTTDRFFESRHKTIDPILKSIQTDLESNLWTIERKQKQSSKNHEDVYNLNVTADEEFQNASSQLSFTAKQQKKIRFDINSSEEGTAKKEDLFSPYQPTSVSQPQMGTVSQETTATQRERKFFKSRGSGCKKYGSQRKTSKKQ